MKLRHISSAPICPDRALPIQNRTSKRMEELYRMLSEKNGFYAFESALRVFPICQHREHMNLQRWNETATWKSAFGNVLDSCVCFAEDTVGDQFAILDDKVVGVNAESGEIHELASTLEEWACRVLTEYEVLTAYPLAHEWQARGRLLLEGERLVPKKAFIFGGDYSVDNLYALEAAAAMRMRGDLYRQIRDLPDGAKVTISVQ
jgi:hypothetical protein